MAWQGSPEDQCAHRGRTKVAMRPIPASPFADRLLPCADGPRVRVGLTVRRADYWRKQG